MNNKTTQPREQAAIDKTCTSPLATRPVLYTDTVGGKQTCRDDLWAVTTDELNALHRASPVAAPEAPILPQQFVWLKRSMNGAGPLTECPPYSAGSIRFAAPIVPEVAASEQQCDEEAYVQSGYRHFMSMEKFRDFRAGVIPAATTVCAPNCFYGDCPPCVEAGLVPAAATTASADKGEKA